MFNLLHGRGHTIAWTALRDGVIGNGIDATGYAPADAAPRVGILSPFAGQILIAGLRQSVTASAFDADGNFADTVIGTGASLEWHRAGRWRSR